MASLDQRVIIMALTVSYICASAIMVLRDYGADLFHIG